MVTLFKIHPHNRRDFSTWSGRLMLLACTLLAGGCGTTRESNATQQLLLSDAVDRSVAKIDFRPLSGKKVYLDTSYLRSNKHEGLVNADYVISGLRQQIVAAGCLLQDSSDQAEIIIEPRLGTLGSDDHRVTYGVPENNGLGSAVSMFAAAAPAPPQIPEIAVARRDAREGAAKIAVFAYDRETRLAVWQSGISKASSTARDTWVMGVGPFQRGSIRKETKLAGAQLFQRNEPDTPPAIKNDPRPLVDFTAETKFDQGWPMPSFRPDQIEALLPGRDLPEFIRPVSATQEIEMPEAAPNE